MSVYKPHHGAQAPEAPPQPGHHPAGAWQTLVAAYLSRRCDMGPVSVSEVLRACEHDQETRAQYLRMAREIAQ